MLSENDIKAELSYAYLHAVSAHAGFGCSVAHRHLDNIAVHVPMINVLTPYSLRQIATRISLGEEFAYGE